MPPPYEDTHSSLVASNNMLYVRSHYDYDLHQTCTNIICDRIAVYNRSVTVFASWRGVAPRANANDNHVGYKYSVRNNSDISAYRRMGHVGAGRMVMSAGSSW